MSPRASDKEPPERVRVALIVKTAVAVSVADLPRVLIRCLRAVHVLLHTRRVADVELAGQELHRDPRHIQRILQEPTHRTNRAQLHRETKAMVIRSMPRNQVPIRVIEVEEPLYLGP